MLDTQTQPVLGSEQVATTNNWDTVFAVDFQAVNDGIAARARYPGTFVHPIPADTSPDEISGSFSGWRLTGGSGHLLEMEMDIPSFICKRSGMADETRSNAKVFIQLSLFTETGTEGSGLGGGTPVSFKLRPSNLLMANSEDFSVVVTGFEWPGSSGEQDLADDCRLLMAGYFNRDAVKDEFDHTFATVNINSRLSTGETDFTWIAPTDTSYGVIANGAQGGGTFAVLCMVQGHEAPDHHNVSPEIIGSNRSGFLINKPVFLQNMIRPGLAAMFGRAPDDEAFFTNCFTIDSDSITNTEALVISDFSVKDSPSKDDLVEATYPKRSFTISMLDTRLVINFNGMTHPYYKLLGIGGAYLYDAHHYYTLQAQADFDPATKKFGLVPVEEGGEPLVTYRAALEKSALGTAIDIGLLVVDILAIAGSIFKGVSIFKAARGATVAVEATEAGKGFVTILGSAKLATIANTLKSFFVHPITVMLGSVSLAVGGIALGVYNEAWENLREEEPENIKPDMQEFATSVLAPVEWPTDAGLAVENVAFNGGLHITGTPDFTTEDQS